MAKSPLILAALAKDAVPQLDFVQAMPLSLGHGGHFDSAVLTATDGKHYVVRQANNAEAELELDTEAVVLRALSPLRSHFPFEITRQVGETKDEKGKRALLYTYVYGEPIDFANRPGTSPLVTSVANALAAIHSLPLSVVENSGLPSFTADLIIRSLTSELDRFAQTGRVPAALLNRWERALEDVNIWRFQPAVIHGSANLNNFLVLDEGVSAVLGWHTLRIGDPAADFALVQGIASDDFSYSALLEYERIKGADQNFRARAQLYSEFELGRYLLWALAQDQSAIDDAQKYLDDLAADIEAGLVGPIGPKPLGTDAILTSTNENDSPSGFDAGFGGHSGGGFSADLPLATPAGMVDAGQELVSDDWFLNLGQAAEPAAAAMPSAFTDDATAPIQLPLVAQESSDDLADGLAEDMSDATAPLDLGALADFSTKASDEAVDDKAPKSGELF